MLTLSMRIHRVHLQVQVAVCTNITTVDQEIFVLKIFRRLTVLQRGVHTHFNFSRV